MQEVLFTGSLSHPIKKNEKLNPFERLESKEVMDPNPFNKNIELEKTESSYIILISSSKIKKNILKHFILSTNYSIICN